MFQIRAVQIQLELRSLPKVADSNTPLHLAPHNHDSKPLRILDLVFHESYCSVKTKTGESIGVLESRALICFSPLSKGHYPIRFEGVLLESEWQERLLTAKSGGRIEQRIVAEVDVFGPRHMSHKVAKTLGDASLFLQRPFFHHTRTLNACRSLTPSTRLPLIGCHILSRTPSRIRWCCVEQPMQARTVSLTSSSSLTVSEVLNIRGISLWTPESRRLFSSKSLKTDCQPMLTQLQPPERRTRLFNETRDTQYSGEL